MSKKFARAIVKTIDQEKGRLIAAVGSTDTVDRYGEVIDQDSWNFTNFRKNPVLLWAHNLTMGEERPPIGRLENFSIEVVDAVKGIKGLVFDAVFDMKDPFAADIFRKYAEGFLNAFSVGFIAHSMEWVEDVPVLKDNELLEMSAVPVPANPEALAQLRARSFAVRDFNKMVKEAEAEAKEEGDEAEAAAKPTEPAKPADETPAAETTGQPAGEPATVPTTQPAIVDDASTQPGITEGQDSKTSPKKPSQNSVEKQQLSVAVIRQATGMLQEALRLFNESQRS